MIYSTLCYVMLRSDELWTGKMSQRKKTVLFLCVVVVVVAAFYSSFIKAISIQAAMSFTSAYAV